jgi:aminopeptidase-like protein
MTDPNGTEMYRWVSDLFPICRSITGDGTLESLRYFAEILPEMKIHSVRSGTQVFDWTVPNEWNISDAYIKDVNGKKIVDFKSCNLHVMGYSTPVQKTLTFRELEPHLYSLPERPEAIPYVTSYYQENWGFCLSDQQLAKLRLKPDAKYDVRIVSEIKPGQLNIGELVVPGNEQQEVLFSSYLCHPSMANNELSGPTVMTALARWVSSLSERKYTYRFLYSVETIGTIAYLSENLDHLKEQLVAGFVLSCVGDERAASYVPSRNGDSFADRIAKHVLKHRFPEFNEYTYLDRGSDERQFCSPGVDLPVCTICRSKFGEYPEYHTSDDNLDLVTPVGLMGSLEIFKDCIRILENTVVPVCNFSCEPQLGKRGMYPNTSTRESGLQVQCLTDLIAYSDGERDLVEIAEIIGQPATRLIPMLRKLSDEQIVELRPKRIHIASNNC